MHNTILSFRRKRMRGPLPFPELFPAVFAAPLRVPFPASFGTASWAAGRAAIFRSQFDFPSSMGSTASHSLSSEITSKSTTARSTRQATRNNAEVDLGLHVGTLHGPFSVVSAPMFATKRSFCRMLNVMRSTRFTFAPAVEKMQTFFLLPKKNVGRGVPKKGKIQGRGFKRMSTSP